MHRRASELGWRRRQLRGGAGRLAAQDGRLAQVGVDEHRIREVRAAQARAAQVGAGEVRAVEPRHAQVRAAEVGAGEPRLAKAAIGEARASQPGMAQVDGGEVELAEIGIRQVRALAMGVAAQETQVHVDLARELARRQPPPAAPALLGLHGHSRRSCSTGDPRGHHVPSLRASALRRG